MHNKPHTEETKAKMRAARLGKPAPWKHRATQEVGGVTHYQCGTCKDFKPATNFYANKRTLLGIKSQCKGCHSATSIASRNADLARATNAAYMARAREADPERFRARERARTRPVDHKVLARQEVNNAVKRGDLLKPTTCEGCGESKKLTGHHDDYSKPLDVRWLCYSCHGKEHRVVEFKRLEQPA